MTAKVDPERRDLDDAALWQEWEAEGRSMRDDIEEMLPMLSLRLIPLGIVTILLTTLLGDWALVLWLLGSSMLLFARWFISAWRRHESALPLPLPGGIRLFGEQKQRVIRIVAIGVPAIAAIGYLGERWINRGLFLIRDVLLEWTIPWSAFGF